MPYLCMLFYLHQGVWPAWCITGSASTQENWQEISTWTLLHQDWWKFPRIFLPQFWSRGKSVCKNLGEKGKKKELKFNLLESEKKDEWHNIYLVSLDLVNIKKASILLLIWFDVCNCNFTFFSILFPNLGWIVAFLWWCTTLLEESLSSVFSSSSLQVKRIENVNI